MSELKLVPLDERTPPLANESLLTNFDAYVKKRFSATKLTLFDDAEEITVLGIFEEDVKKAFQILNYGEPELVGSCIEVAEGKTANNMRPTWYRSKDKKCLALIVFPGEDYVLHYGLCLKAYLNGHGQECIKVHCKICRTSEERIVEYTELGKFVGKLDGYVVVVGPTHFIKLKMADPQKRQIYQLLNTPQSKWYSQTRYKSNDRYVLLLDIKYCFWGSIAKYVARCLYDQGASEIIHCGKVGTLAGPDRQYKISIPSGTYILNDMWDPLEVTENQVKKHFRSFSRTVSPENFLFGPHTSVPSVLLETYTTWNRYTQDASATVDAEVVYIAYEAYKLGKRFSCVHWISDFLCPKDYKEELKSKEGLDKTDTQKETEAKKQMSAVIVEYLERITGITVNEQNPQIQHVNNQEKHSSYSRRDIVIHERMLGLIVTDNDMDKIIVPECPTQNTDKEILYRTTGLTFRMITFDYWLVFVIKKNGDTKWTKTSVELFWKRLSFSEAVEFQYIQQANTLQVVKNCGRYQLKGLDDLQEDLENTACTCSPDVVGYHKITPIEERREQHNLPFDAVKSAKAVIMQYGDIKAASCFANWMYTLRGLPQEKRDQFTEFQIIVDKDIGNPKLLRLIVEDLAKPPYDSVLVYYKKTNSTLLRIVSTPVVFAELFVKWCLQRKSPASQHFTLKGEPKEYHLNEHTSSKEIIDSVWKSMGSFPEILYRILIHIDGTVCRLISKECYNFWWSNTNSIHLRTVDDKMLEEITDKLHQNKSLQLLSISDSPQLTTKVLQRITQLTTLTDISFVRYGSINESLQYLKSMSNLVNLHIEGSRIPSSTSLGKLTLSSLELSKVYGITNEDLRNITLLSGLQSLIMFNCHNVTDEGMECLKSLQLTKLMISGNRSIKFQSVTLWNSFLTLEVLGLEDMELTDDSLQFISELINLKSLYLSSNPNLTLNGFRYMSLPNLEYLCLANCRSITGEVFSVLQNFSNLNALSLRDCRKITDESIKQVIEHDHLTFLNISGCYKVSDEVIQSIIEACKENNKQLTIQRDYVYSTQKQSPLYNKWRENRRLWNTMMTATKIFPEDILPRIISQSDSESLKKWIASKQIIRLMSQYENMIGFPNLQTYLHQLLGELAYFHLWSSFVAKVVGYWNFSNLNIQSDPTLVQNRVLSTERWGNGTINDINERPANTNGYLFGKHSHMIVKDACPSDLLCGPFTLEVSLRFSTSEDGDKQKLIVSCVTQNIGWELNGNTRGFSFIIRDETANPISINCEQEMNIEDRYLVAVMRTNDAIKLCINDEILTETKLPLSQTKSSIGDLDVASLKQGIDCKFHGRICDIRITRAALYPFLSLSSNGQSLPSPTIVLILQVISTIEKKETIFNVTTEPTEKNLLSIGDVSEIPIESPDKNDIVPDRPNDTSTLPSDVEDSEQKEKQTKQDEDTTQKVSTDLQKDKDTAQKDKDIPLVDREHKILNQATEDRFLSIIWEVPTMGDIWLDYIIPYIPLNWLYVSKFYNNLVFKHLLDDSRVNPARDNNYPIYYAAKSGYFRVVKLLIRDSRVNLNANDNKALRSALLNGHVDVVGLLLQNYLHSSDNYPLQMAIEDRNASLIEKLIHKRTIDSKQLDAYTIRMAGKGGHDDILKHYLQRQSGNQYQTAFNDAFTLSVIHNQYSTVKLLLPKVKDVNVLIAAASKLKWKNENPISLLLQKSILDVFVSERTNTVRRILELTTQPESISILTNSIELFLSYDQLTILPSSLLTKLDELDLSNNQLTSLPSSISTLTNLIELYLNDNQLTSLPWSISTLLNLNMLDLGNNQLSTLSESISALTNLNKLNIYRNRLSTLPSSISALTNLNVLDLGGNQLSTLPTWISTLTNLVQFNIDYNPLISPPLTIAQQGLEAIRHYFEAESNNRLKTLKISNKKVLLVGEGEVGKTSFFQALKRETNQFESETNERTKGIDVHSLELKNGAVSIWDFAGQEEFFSSHNIFTKDNLGRSLFIVVFRLHDGDEVIKQSIKKWTSIALEQSPQSNIILVGTHLDKVEDVEEQKKFIEIIYFALEESVRERIKELFCVSNETKQGIEQVKAFIDDQIQQEFNLPSICVEVFEQIKHFKVTEKKEYIFADEITVQISQDILNIALAFFHSVGEMIHFIDSDNSANNTNKNTKNLIILNPDWLSKQMAKLIQKGKKYSTQGWISVSTCFGIWNIDKNIGEQLILIMHRIKLVYFDKRKNEVLVNQLLPATNNQDFIDEPIKYGRIWQFNFVIPMGLFEHVHFNLLELKLFDIEAWKNYLKLEQGESTAIIQIFNDGEYALAPQLRVIACGNEKSSIMMKIMVEFIDGLLKEEFKNSKFIRRVCCTCEQCLTNMKINGELCHWPLSDEDKLNNERGMHSILSRSDTVKCSISKSVLPLNKIQFEKNIDNSESHSTKSLNKISAATRAEIASEIATRSNWDRLGLQFEKELGKTFPRMALVAEQGEHAPPITLVQHLIEKLAAMLLSVSSFKAALVKLGMPDIAKMFAKDLDETSAPTVNQPQGNYNNNAYQHQRKKATLVEVNPKHAAEHFSTKLVFDIQGAVTIGYKELAKKVGWTRIGQLVNHMGPDNEIASLLELIYKQQGHAGLKKIRDALASASEIRALDIIDNSPCATMFQ